MNFNLIDHVLFGGNDLEASTRHVQNLTGSVPLKGGSHPGKGTHNYLLGLSHCAYLEIIGPDTGQSTDRVWMNLDQKTTPSLFRWAAKCDDMEGLMARAQKHGIDLGTIQKGSRKKPDGTLLEWELTDPDVVIGDGLVPFFIDWGDKGSPAGDLPVAGTVTSFYGLHPDPDLIADVLHKLGIDMEVKKADRPGLFLECANDGYVFQLA